MKLKQLLETLKEKNCYKKFIEENPGSYLCAIFTVVGETPQKYHLDFYSPSTKKIAVFEHPFENIQISSEESEPLEKVEENLFLDIDGIQECSEKLKNDNGIFQNTKKIISVLTNGVWNLTCMDDMLGMINIRADAYKDKCQEFKKGSIMDMVRVVKKE